MKSYNNYLKFIFVLSLIFNFSSCSNEYENEFASVVPPENMPWQANTGLKIKPEKDKEAFIWETNLLTQEQYWKNKEVTLHINLKSPVPATDFEKIDFYLTAQEKDGYNYNPPYDTEGRFYKTVTGFPESGDFILKIDAEEAYDLFKNDFVNPRPNAPLLEGDLFELHWVITYKDATTLNSKDYIGSEYRFGFATLYKDFAPPVWEGSFDYEWIYVSDGGIQWGGVDVGDTGQINIVETEPGSGLYDVDDLSFGYKYGGPGQIKFDFTSGLLTVIDDTWREQKWSISNINGPTLEITWTYKYTESYDEWGTVTLTRTDGANWPENIHTEN